MDHVSRQVRVSAHPIDLTMLATVVAALIVVSDASAQVAPAPVKAVAAAQATKQSAPRPRVARKAPASSPVAVVPVVIVRQFPTPRFNDIMTTVLYRDRETANLLLDMGRWVDKPDSVGLTPLIVAVMYRFPDMAQLLLERGADPNLPGPGGASAMTLARRNGDAVTVAMLQRSGARE